MEWSTNAFCFPIQGPPQGMILCLHASLFTWAFHKVLSPYPHPSKCMLSSVIVILSSEMKQVSYPICSKNNLGGKVVFAFLFSFIFISWRLITLQYCSGFCHTLTWISHGFTCVPHLDSPSLLPPHPIPLGLPSAPALSTCLMHPTWAGGLFHPW